MKKHGLCASENMTHREKDIILLQCAVGGAERGNVARTLGAREVFKESQGLLCGWFPLNNETIIVSSWQKLSFFVPVDEKLNNSIRQLQFNTSL